MPYAIRRGNGEGCRFEVVVETTGKRVGCHPDRASARRHLAALYANVPEAKTISSLLDRESDFWVNYRKTLVKAVTPTFTRIFLAGAKAALKIPAVESKATPPHPTTTTAALPSENAQQYATRILGFDPYSPQSSSQLVDSAGHALSGDEITRAVVTGQLASSIAGGTLAVTKKEWDEDAHPRDEGGRFTDSGFVQDNPLTNAHGPEERTRAEEWLRQNPHTVTAYFRENVQLNPREVARVKGLKGEESHINQEKVTRLAESMRQNGYDQSQPIQLEVDRFGRLRIYEGNHRVRAAVEAGLSSIPARVNWLGGGETIYRPETLLGDYGTKKKEWDEDAHPRDEAGKFTDSAADSAPSAYDSWPSTKMQEDFDKAFPKHSDQYFVRERGNVRIGLMPHGMEKDLELHWLQSTQRGSNDAIVAMREVVNMADKHGVTLHLEAMPWSKADIEGTERERNEPKPMELSKLMQFYEHFGFQKYRDVGLPDTTGNRMVRYPNPGKTKWYAYDFLMEVMDESFGLVEKKGPVVATAVSNLPKNLPGIAKKAIKQYVNEWSRLIEDTTYEGVREAVLTSRATGGGVEAVIQAIAPLFAPERVQRIAVTETTRLFGRGAQASYEAMGLQEWGWSTVNDPWVCFPPGTMVMVNDQEMPIEQVSVGDTVKTMRGHDVVTDAWVHPATEMVRIDLESGPIFSTPDHRLWVIGSGWTRAADISSGDALKNAANEAVYVIGVCEFILRHTNNGDSFLSQNSFTGGAGRPDRMPVVPVNFKADAIIRQEEVQAIPSNCELLHEIDAQTLQGLTDNALQSCFANGLSVTGEGAELSLALPSSLNHSSTILTDSLGISASLALHRAVGVSVGYGLNHNKRQSTADTELGDSFSSVSAFKATEDLPLATGHGSRIKALPTRSAGSEGILPCGLVIAILRTINHTRIAPLRNGATTPLAFGNSRHVAASYHGQGAISIAVHDIKVKNDPTFFANGILVHNCGSPGKELTDNAISHLVFEEPCYDLDGKTFPIDQMFEPNHVNCRCFSVPIVTYGGEEKDWDPDLHPRDELGQFALAGGGSAVAEAPENTGGALPNGSLAIPGTTYSNRTNPTDSYYERVKALMAERGAPSFELDNVDIEREQIAKQYGGDFDMYHIDGTNIEVGVPLDRDLDPDSVHQAVETIRGLNEKLPPPGEVMVLLGRDLTEMGPGVQGVTTVPTTSDPDIRKGVGALMLISDNVVANPYQNAGEVYPGVARAEEVTAIQYVISHEWGHVVDRFPIEKEVDAIFGVVAGTDPETTPYVDAYLNRGTMELNALEAAIQDGKVPRGSQMDYAIRSEAMNFIALGAKENFAESIAEYVLSKEPGAAPMNEWTEKYLKEIGFLTPTGRVSRKKAIDFSLTTFIDDFVGPSQELPEVLKEWDEDLHPRDEAGRFTSGDGGIDVESGVAYVADMSMGGTYVGSRVVDEQEFVNKYQNAEVEHGLISTEDGRKIEVTSNNQGTIHLEKEAIRAMRNGDFIHNHPLPGIPLSGGDVVAAVQTGCKSITAVSSDGSISRMEEPKGGWFLGSKEDAQSAAMALAVFHPDYDANKPDDYIHSQNRALWAFARDTGAKYTYIPGAH